MAVAQIAEHFPVQSLAQKPQTTILQTECQRQTTLGGYSRQWSV